MALAWTKETYGEDAILRNPDDSTGVRFSLDYYPTCHRRGRYRLLIEVMSGTYHEAWGCFDSQDQPMRFYHSCDRAKAEAQAIADILLKEFGAVYGAVGG